MTFTLKLLVGMQVLRPTGLTAGLLCMLGYALVTTVEETCHTFFTAAEIRYQAGQRRNFNPLV